MNREDADVEGEPTLESPVDTADLGRFNSAGRVETLGHERPAAGSALGLAVLTGPDEGRMIELRESTVVGRDPSCDLVLAGARVSRRHLELRRVSKDSFLAEDLNSRNGIEVNGMALKRGKVSLGDRILIGGESMLCITAFDPILAHANDRLRMESIGELAGGVAHDLNNLLQAIDGNINVLSRFLDPENELLMDIVRDLEHACQASSELTHDLLGFSRPADAQLAEVDVTSLVQSVTRLCSRSFGPRYPMTVDAPAGITFRGDATRLDQLLLNLLVNARDSMPDGGPILTRVRDTTTETGEGNIVIDVVDQGSGIPPGDRERIFEPFFTTKERGQGTGLGLPSVRSVVRAHGGRVRVSDNPVGGTIFTVELPTSSALIDPMQETAEGIPAIKSSPRGTVLLIEDNELACRSTARVLRSCGYTVTTAGGGLEGLEKYRAQVPAFQAVVLDWTMPQMTGADTAAALYAIDPNVRILAISGYQSAVEVTASAHAGVRHFLGKPFTQESIDISLQLIL